ASVSACVSVTVIAPPLSPPSTPDGTGASRTPGRTASGGARLTPREFRHTFVSLMAYAGVREELIADLVGHQRTSTTRTVYRHQLRPVITAGAEALDGMFYSVQMEMLGSGNPGIELRIR